jgi:hypothetical protein
LDVIIYMMTFLTPHDLALTSRLSKYFQDVAESDQVWKSLYVRHMEEPSLPSPSVSTEDEEGNGLCVDHSQQCSWKMRYRRSREWQWDSSLRGKASPLKVDHMNRTVSRPSQEGINPIVRTTKPFTRYRNYVEIIIERVGTWFRCGVADTEVALDDGNLLGGQGQGVNIGYCKSGSLYYSYYGHMNKKITSIDVRKRIVSGCRLGIHWDPDTHKFGFYFDGELVESLQLLGKPIPTSSNSSAKNGNPQWEDLALYPTVQLSYTSQVTINHKYCHRPPTIPTSSSKEASQDILGSVGELDASAMEV